MREFDRFKRRKKILNFLLTHAEKLIIFCILVGIINGLLLGSSHPSIQQKIFCSENAILPNHANTEYSFKEYTYVVSNLDKVEQFSIEKRTEWLISEFAHLGLMSYLHEPTTCPSSFSSSFSSSSSSFSNCSTNVYAILHAPRGDGTDALVLSASWYNELTEKDNSIGVLMTLSLAKLWKKYSYWAKDIIILISPNLNSGEQWVQDYFKTPLKTSSSMMHAGELHAALHLDIPEPNPNQLEVDYTGYHGQVPNLDYLSLIRTVAKGFSMPIVFHTSTTSNKEYVGYWTSLFNLFIETKAQLHRPTSIHGMFRHYGVHAITLRGIHHPDLPKVGGATVPGMVESVFRSLNNLIERFHAGFFLYLVPSPSRFISMTLYLPMLACILVAWMSSSLLHFFMLPSLPWSTLAPSLWLCGLVFTLGLVQLVVPSWLCVPLTLVFIYYVHWTPASTAAPFLVSSSSSSSSSSLPLSSLLHSSFLTFATRFLLSLGLLCFALIHFSFAFFMTLLLVMLDFVPRFTALPSLLRWSVLGGFHPFSFFYFLPHTLSDSVFTFFSSVYFPMYLIAISLLPLPLLNRSQSLTKVDKNKAE